MCSPPSPGSCTTASCDGGVEHLADRVDPLEALLLEDARAGPATIGSTSAAPWATAPSHASSTGSSRSTSAPDARATSSSTCCCDLLAEVVEVGRGALVGVEELVALGGDALEVGSTSVSTVDLRRAASRVVEELALDDLVVSPASGSDVGHGDGSPAYADCSSSTISASTTSSSDGCDAPAPRRRPRGRRRRPRRRASG